MKKLHVNFSGGRLVFNGSVSGIRYQYDPKLQNGTMFVNDSDVPELLKMTAKSGCGCKKDGQSEPIIEYHIFEEII